MDEPQLFTVVYSMESDRYLVRKPNGKYCGAHPTLEEAEESRLRLQYPEIWLEWVIARRQEPDHISSSLSEYIDKGE